MLAATFASLIGWTLGCLLLGLVLCMVGTRTFERAPYLVGTPDRPGIVPILRPAAHRTGRRPRRVLRGLRMVWA